MSGRHSTTATKHVACPTCGEPVPWSPESPWRPFCSERCKLIDLGEWLDEGHRISEPLGSDLDPYTKTH